MTDKDDIAALKKELADLKAKVSPEPYDPAAAAKWASDMHNIREARMGRASAFSRADFEAFEAAAPTSVVKDIAMRDARAPTGRPGTIPIDQQPTSVRSSVPPGGGTGWAREIPFGPSPHQRYVDAQLDAQDLKDRRELIEQKAKEQALLKAATEDESK